MDTQIPTPAQLLTRAADILDQRGWNQNWYISDDGRVCAIGAINLAASEADGRKATDEDAESEWDGISPVVTQARTDALDALGDVVISQSGCCISEWNDEPGRTKGQVQDALRRAAGGAS